MKRGRAPVFRAPKRARGARNPEHRRDSTERASRPETAIRIGHETPVARTVRRPACGHEESEERPKSRENEAARPFSGSRRRSISHSFSRRSRARLAGTRAKVAIPRRRRQRGSEAELPEAATKMRPGGARAWSLRDRSSGHLLEHLDLVRAFCPVVRRAPDTLFGASVSRTRNPPILASRQSAPACLEPPACDDQTRSSEVAVSRSRNVASVVIPGRDPGTRSVRPDPHCSIAAARNV